MPLVCLVVAMTAEARPLVDAFHLHALPQRGIDAWIGDGVCLLKTGMGSQRAEARLTALLALQSGINAFINVGVAGGKRNIGDVILADSIINNSSGKRWFPHLPPLPIANDIANCSVVTVVEPCSDYRTDCVFDMEAAAVASVGTKHTDLSRVHAIKVISDNDAQPLSDFSVKSVTPLMRKTVPSTTNLVNWLATSLPQGSENSVAEFTTQVENLTQHITSVCHHTVTETHRLRRLLERYYAQHGQLPNVNELGRLDSSHNLLQRLDHEVSSYSLVY